MQYHGGAICGHIQSCWKGVQKYLFDQLTLTQTCPSRVLAAFFTSSPVLKTLTTIKDRKEGSDDSKCGYDFIDALLKKGSDDQRRKYRTKHVLFRNVIADPRSGYHDYIRSPRHIARHAQCLHTAMEATTFEKEFHLVKGELVRKRKRIDDIEDQGDGHYYNIL
ncbi:hypothetical protein K457DRAFT_24306 [Linnemannia elongata AG-77]|uniref:Uncharacterized protein n=1 Tax=Linnemannia elongata AG-77 TaxID=1314771 RepID=A0A197JGY1_9FUNG|nr:hypothetical protein K457DRAFT_24306 [Linnemannia elongata AG-77]